MSLFILLTRLSPGIADTPQACEGLERRVMDRIREHVPDVEWKHSYATLGPRDYLDIFQADTVESALKVAAIVRMYGNATAEVWPAVEWRRFKDILHELPDRSGP